MLFYLLINHFPSQDSKRKRKHSTENEENRSPLIVENVNIADKLAQLKGSEKRETYVMNENEKNMIFRKSKR